MEKQKQKQKRNSKLTTASDVLQSLLENVQTPIGDQFIRWRLTRAWSEVAGPTLGANSSPVDYRQGVLYVWVKSSSWMHHMTFASETLKDKVNKFVGRPWATQIRLTQHRRD